MIGERIEPTKRKPLTPKQKAEILNRQNDCCGNCGESLIWLVMDDGKRVYGPFIDEHILQLFVGGSNELSNRQIWCISCSKAKTKKEATENAKTRRLIAREDGTRRERLVISSRGFDKTKRKKMNGTVVPREGR